MVNMDLDIDNWMVAWTPAEAAGARSPVIRGHAPPGSIKVGPWPDERGWSDRYAMTIGCCMLERHKWPLDHKVMMMFIDFHSCVVGDGIDPQAAHREFLKIAEYRRRISPDIEGADQPA